jgi:hypothetical protein
MGNYANDPCAAAEIEQKVRERVDWALRGQAQVAEFTVGTMFEGRPALDKAEREVAVALNVMSELFGHRAREASEAQEDRWEGLADAATMAWNELGRRGLPQVANRGLDFEDEDLEP